MMFNKNASQIFVKIFCYNHKHISNFILTYCLYKKKNLHFSVIIKYMRQHVHVHLPCIESFFGFEVDDWHVPGQGELKVFGLFGWKIGLDTDCCCTLLTFTCTGRLTYIQFTGTLF